MAKKESPSLPPEIKTFIKSVEDRNVGDFAETNYGHAVVALASVATLGGTSGKTHQQQRALLRQSAERKIQKYGKGIIPFLRDELKLALIDED
ncbi:hypothetical protein ISR94_01615 [Candidatus Microgenomates bacterium]|nr:hypothetical protein [Candidatus Microgenomates bacterium]